MLLVHYSNRLERLLEKLKVALFEESAPFTRRMIIVPSPAMKSWLMLQMARDPDLGIATGLEIIHPHQAIVTLSSLCGIPEKHPSLLELSLAIEEEILSVIAASNQQTESEKSLWQPLLDYLKVSSSSPLSHKTQRRLAPLCEELASLFKQYGLYGGSLMTQWEKGKTEHWQQALWKRLFHPQRWSAAHQLLSPWIEQSTPPLNATNRQIHLFAVSFLPSLHHRFLVGLSEWIPLSYYMLSPCSVFWSDIQSDRERRRQQLYWQRKGATLDQQLELDEYLRDRNPLLANFGRLGREMAQSIEESKAVAFEEYQLPASLGSEEAYSELMTDEMQLEPSDRPASLLDHVQGDMLLLRNPANQQKIVLPSHDGSMQVHFASSRMREVEVLYDALMQIVTRHAQDEEPITPGDIFVMAPDINLYVPYIQAVFGASESRLQAQIFDTTVLLQHALVQQFQHLLDLAQGRWDAVALLQLMEAPAFLNRQQWQREDLRAIREWISAMDIRWGTDPAHRDSLLQRDYCVQGMMDKSPVGTWEHAFSKLLSGMVITPGDESSLGYVDPMRGPLLGQWIALVRSLRHDLQPLHDGTCLTVKEWVNYLRGLYTAYFSALDQDKEAEEELLGQFETLLKAASAIQETAVSFPSIEHYLNSLMTQGASHYREHALHTVRFSALLPMRAIPCKVIALIGMEEGAFPRQRPASSLNLLAKEPSADYAPTSTDYDRFLFLETLLSARRYFLLSYSGASGFDGSEAAPSLLVTELLAYLDQAYQVEDALPSQVCWRKHPFHRFDARYFSPEGEFPSFSQRSYREAMAYYRPEKISPPHFFSMQASAKDQGDSVSAAIRFTIQELSAFARNPVRRYFNKTLGIYLETAEDRQLKSDEEFHLTPLQSHLLKQNAFTHSPDQIVRLAEREDRLPIGPFKQPAVERLQNELGGLRKNLAMLGVHPETLQTLTLSEQYSMPKKVSDQEWHLPPLSLQHQGQTFQVVGTLRDIASQGMVVSGKDDPIDILKIWPHYLLLNCVTQQYQLPIESALLMTKGSKGKRIVPTLLDPQTILGDYLNYACICLEHPSPLVPEWTSAVLTRDPKVFAEIMRESLSNPFNPMYNVYLRWAFDVEALPDSAVLMERWLPYAERLFGTLFKK